MPTVCVLNTSNGESARGTTLPDVRGDHVASHLWSTSELIVCDWDIASTPDFQLRAQNHEAVQGQWTDTAVSEVRGRHLVLRFLFIPFGQAP